MQISRVWLAVLAFAVVFAITTVLMGGDGEVLAAGGLVLLLLAGMATVLGGRAKRVD